MSDILSNPSRNFYERTKAKCTLSLLVASSAMMLLGFGAYSGGLAQSMQVQVGINPFSRNFCCKYELYSSLGACTFLFVFIFYFPKLFSVLLISEIGIYCYTT